VLLGEKAMAQCILTGKKLRTANKVSHANNKTKRRQYPNVQSRRIFVPGLDRFVRLYVSTAAIRTITRIGIETYAKKVGLDLSKLVQA
jgi:large subunit ribosomal protein L28